MHSSSATATPRGTPARRGKSPRFRGDSPPNHPGLTSHSSNLDNKPASTITSSLDILVEGVIPFDADSSKNVSTVSSVSADQPSTSESKRAPRKSKTDALAALSNHARSSSPGPDDFEPQDLTEKYRSGPPISVSRSLDLSTVKTPSRATRTPPPPKSRPFGLPDCPEYRPTAEEFKDPMAYIHSISEEAKAYGICKVIPPDDWQMPFVTDTERFRFQTRVQRLNSIEATARAKVNFLEQLYRFHKQQGNPRVAVPTINHKPLDLWLLRKEVHKFGGYQAVTEKRKWSDVARQLGYRGIPGLSTQIKNSYMRVILPYEDFCEKAKNSPQMSAIIERDAIRNGNLSSLEKQSKSRSNSGSRGDESPPSSPLTVTSSPLSEPPDENDVKDGKSISARPRRSTRMRGSEMITPKKRMGMTTPAVRPPVFYDEIPSPSDKSDNTICELCHSADREDEMLLCDGCDSGYHMTCLVPPLTSVPKDSWYCYLCLSGTGGDFGFDEGEEHSLSSFQARDLEFRRMWFESHPPPQHMDTGPECQDQTVNRFGNTTVTEHDVEREFWRLVQSPHETVEIEYGADVHSTFHGSAMPTLEAHPLESYAKDPWNLNNIAILNDSLLRYIKSDISGMTVPWIYVGMVFSTFCWHNEDHYTYSINFMHWGETKTWYGIPGEDAEKFEAAIKSEAPDLFEAQPDLLFQLVTLMNPERITQAGVRVYACNQRAGEFVITFPKAYHAGFNHGLNFNEAVNFALPDWLPYGLECVQRYREHRKLPVFSHDELLITITQHTSSITTATWLLDSLKEMTEREMRDRAKARDAGLPEMLEEEDRPEDQYQCAICKTFCYLSQVICICTAQVACVDHRHLLCRLNHDPLKPVLHKLTLRKRFSDEDLLEKQRKVAERASQPSEWRNKFNNLLSQHGKPPLRNLRALVADAERCHNYHFRELPALKQCVSRAQEWVNEANSVLVRKQSRKRSRRSHGRPSLAGEGSSDDPGNRPDKILDELYTMLEEVKNLGFDCSEIGALRELVHRAEELKARARKLLDMGDVEREDEGFLLDCRKLLLDGSSLNVVIDELGEVELIVDRDLLAKELEEKVDEADQTMTLEEVRHLLERATTCNLPSGNPQVKILNERERLGAEWEQNAQRILSQSVKTIEELNKVAQVDGSVPVDPASLQRLNSARAKANDFERQANIWLLPESDAVRPRVQDVLKLLARAEKDYDIPAVKKLKALADRAAALEVECEQIRRDRTDSASSDRDVLGQIETWKLEADAFKVFSLPAYEKIEHEYAAHCKWLETLPWYCKEHRLPHGTTVLQDVIENTKPEDDLPPTNEFITCICTNPVCPPPNGSVSDAMQCDNCRARFHGACAKSDSSCPFCDHHHWNGTLQKERNWHFCYLPTTLANAPELTKRWSRDWKELEIIVHRVDRLASVIGQFLAFSLQSSTHDPKHMHQIRHYMRKLHKLQFAVSSNPDVSYGLDLAGVHQHLATQMSATKSKKRKRPAFFFAADTEESADGTHCVCGGHNPYYTHCRKVSCQSCQHSYHVNCVFFPPDVNGDKANYLCPLCSLRKGKRYLYADVRVKPRESLEPDVFVDVEIMHKSFSRDMIYKKLHEPTTNTIFVELTKFEPGSDPGTYVSSRSAAPTLASAPHFGGARSAVYSHPNLQSHYLMGKPHPHAPLTSHDPYMHTRMPYPHTGGPLPPTHFAPRPAIPGAPNSWSRWSAVATPTAPPTIPRRINGDHPRAGPLPPLTTPPHINADALPTSPISVVPGLGPASPPTSATPPAASPINGSSNGLMSTPNARSVSLSSSSSTSSSIAGKKRKHTDDITLPTAGGTEENGRGTATNGTNGIVPPSPKRRALPATSVHSSPTSRLVLSPAVNPTPPAKPSPPNSLSPSLAMIVSPVNQS